MGNGVNPFVTGDVNAPSGINLMWNTWMPLPALVMAPVTLLAGPLAAFNSLITLATTLSGFAMYLAARRWVEGRPAAIAAGLAYGFAPYVLVHSYTGHANLALAFTPPLLLILLDVIVVEQTERPRTAGVWLGALALVQLFTTEEILASELVAAVVVVAWLALLHPRAVRSRIAHVVRCLGWALVVFVPVAAGPLWVQFFGPQVPTHPVTDTTFFITDLANVVLPTYSQGIDPGFAQSVALHYLGNSGEWAGYIGIPMLIVAVVTTVRCWRRPVVRIAALSAVTLLLVSFGSSLHVAGVDTHIPMPGWVLAHLPVFDNLTPARFGMYVALAMALLLAVAVDTMPRTRAAARVALVAAAALVAAYLPPIPFPTRAAPVPSFFTASPRPYANGATLLVLPFAHDFYSADAMRWQAAAGVSFAMPEGYVITRLPDGHAGTGPAPSAMQSLFVALADGERTAAQVTAGEEVAVAAEIAADGVSGIVLVDGTPHADQETQVVDAIATTIGGGRPTVEGGVTYWQLAAG